jgi:glycosyltransferase involved in cell wall biosynthesis
VNVTFVYRYLTLGGVEVVLRSRLATLPDLGIQPTVWFLSDGPGRSLFAQSGPSVRVGGLTELREHVSAGQVDLLSVIDTPEALDTVAAAPHRPRVVLEVHTPYPENRIYLRAPACESADAVFVPSEHQRRIVSREMPGAPEVRVVPNPIGEAFEAPLAGQAPGVNGPVVAWIGRLDWLKNWRSFLRIAARVMRRVPNVEFWVAGSGSPDEEADFERESRRSGVTQRLRWLRGVPHPSMPRLYDGVRAGGGAVISTSRGESFGMAVAEAMARGCAAVAPRLGPFPEFITDGVDGRLYRVGSNAHAAQAVVDILTETEARARLGASARERILRLHGTRRAMESLAHALTEVASLAEGRLLSNAPSCIGRSAPQDRGSSPAHAASEGLVLSDQGTALPELGQGDTGGRKALFARYYASGFWPGPGSSVEYTENIRKAIPELLRRLGAGTILDAPCGDYGWFRLIDRNPEVAYIGGDVVDNLIAANQSSFGDVRTRFMVLDITSDALPKADLWLCRDCLFHFSNADIFSALDNFMRSDIRYLLTTTHPRCTHNTDIPTGSFRLLNLEIPPFSFPEPIERMDDLIEGHPVRQLALWCKAAIARVLGPGPARA